MNIIKRKMKSAYRNNPCFWLVLKNAAQYFFYAFVVGAITWQIRSATYVEPEPKVVVETVTERVYVYYNPFKEHDVLSREDELLFTQIVAGESAHEPWEGIAAVAETLKNHLDGGKTLQEAQSLYTGYMEQVPEHVRALCLDVLYEGLEVYGSTSLYFYSPEWMPNGVSEWHETQSHLGTIGGHRFFAQNND